ncbi:MAG: ABC transporter ATP-binding protein, partial [Thermoplasmata archaeon]|nr:ABC transporter ATP-binding protein [Thermoplasmata archaeon]
MTQKEEPFIRIKSLSKSFMDINNPEDVVHAVQDFDLDIAEGEFVCIVGPSGCGKTTLLRCIAGLVEPTHGEVRIRGKRLTGPGAERGYVFQSFALFPWRSVRRNIEFGLEVKGIDKEERRRISDEYIELVGLQGFEDSHPRELSGGMQQRVGLARALANDPEVLLMDEPCSALDPIATNHVEELMWELKENYTIIIVTHSMQQAARVS